MSTRNLDVFPLLPERYLVLRSFFSVFTDSQRKERIAEDHLRGRPLRTRDVPESYHIKGDVIEGEFAIRHWGADRLRALIEDGLLEDEELVST